MSVREEGPLLKPLAREHVPKSEPNIINSAGSEGNCHETNISQTPTLNPNPLFRNGMPLPKEIKNQLTNTLANVPLEEIDPFYFKRNTFVVIGNERIYRFSRNRTLITLSPFNAFRRFSLYLLTHWLFSTFIVAVVLLNCFFALKNTSTNNAFFYISEYVCLAIYTVEFLLEVVGRGLFLIPFSCLRIPWSIFNLFLLINGWLFLANSFWIFKIIYALRIFKVIPYIPGLQICFEFVLKLIGRLRSIFVMGGLVVIVFSTMGIHLFMGTLTQQCIPNTNSTEIQTDSVDLADHENEKELDHPELFCSNYSTASQCGEEYTCLKNARLNPNYEYTSFDSLPPAILQVLRLVMQDYPDDLYQKIWASNSFWHTAYFAGIFLFGTFVLKTYVLTIIAKEILKEGKIATEEEGNSSFQPGKYCNVICGWNCSETFIIVRETVGKFIDHGLTELFICIIIVIDTLSMTFYYYGLQDENPIMNEILYYTSKVCFAVYILEFLIKIVAQSPLNYFQKYWNIFDFLIIVLYTINRVFQRFGIEENIFSVLLVARMFKLGSRWQTLDLQFTILFKVAQDYFSYIGLLLFSNYFFGLLGVHLYKIENTENDLDHENAIWSFGNFFSSSMISFRILCGEWIETLWNCLHVAGKSCFIYSISAVLIFNLFITILSVAIILTTYKILKNRENDTFASDKFTKFSNICKKTKTAFYTLKSKITKRFSNKTAAKIDGVTSNDVQQTENTQQATSNTPSRSTRFKVNKCNQIIATVYEHKFARLMSVVVIIVSSLALIPCDVHYGLLSPSLRITLYSIEIVFTVYFLIDIIMSATSSGFLKSICNLSWLFDTLIISEMVLNLSLLNFNSASFKSSGVLSVRCLRPLMLISRLQRLKAVFIGFTRQLSFLAKFFMTALFIWLYFAIQGVHIYGGLFYSCAEFKGGEYEYVSFAKHECMAMNLTWTNAIHNFDNLASSFLNVALITTRNGWLSIWRNMLTSHREFERSVPIETIEPNIYIIAVVIFGAFFTCNVIFGAVVYHVKRNKENFMTFDQVEEYNKRKQGTLSATVIDKPTLGPLTFIHDVVFSTIFDCLVMALIVVDTLALAAASFNSSDRILATRSLVFSVVTFLYTLELILKLIGWRHHYFKTPLNVLDMIVVLFSLSGYLFDNNVLAVIIAVIRTLRIIRILHFKPFLRLAEKISTFLLGLSRIYPVIVNLLFLLGLFFFTFAVFGMSLFKNVANQSIPEMVNFTTFLNSTLAIFQMTTFSGWDEILNTVANEYDCAPLHCGNFTQAIIFCLSYLSIVFVIVTNMYCLFVLEILNCFDDIKECFADIPNPNVASDSVENANIVVETINLNPSCSVSARRKSVACFVIEDSNGNKDAQIVILPRETVQVVLK